MKCCFFLFLFFFTNWQQCRHLDTTLLFKIFWLIFNGMPIHLGLYYAKRLRNHIVHLYLLFWVIIKEFFYTSEQDGKNVRIARKWCVYVCIRERGGVKGWYIKYFYLFNIIAETPMFWEALLCRGFNQCILSPVYRVISNLNYSALQTSTLNILILKSKKKKKKRKSKDSFPILFDRRINKF